MSISIADLHCDLLLYLAGEENRTLFDAQARCSLPQLRTGGVKLQVLPIFSETVSGSSRSGEKQVEIFGKLPQEHFTFLERGELPEEKIGVMLAIENGSAFCSEEDDLEARLKWLEALHHKVLYISFTWNSENRFGGGAHTSLGLKEDGKRLLDFLDKRRICVDLSHTSDKLAEEILEYCDQKGLDIPIIASHSNLRAVTDVARNLPDHLAKEVIRRGGVIGLNFVNRFVGKSPAAFVVHLQHLLELGGKDHCCLGADFYYGGDLSPENRRDLAFFEEFANASTYPRLFKLWKENGISEGQLEKITHVNLMNFLDRKVFYREKVDF